mmetsp:Transcript_972/g.1220  ORF Transcript_972/g.1220 Transcript_972/m.1220 type:complete len:211 (+) Transcript_972:1063-1695(+)
MFWATTERSPPRQLPKAADILSSSSIKLYIPLPWSEMALSISSLWFSPYPNVKILRAGRSEICICSSLTSSLVSHIPLFASPSVSNSTLWISFAFFSIFEFITNLVASNKPPLRFVAEPGVTFSTIPTVLFFPSSVIFSKGKASTKVSKVTNANLSSSCSCVRRNLMVSLHISSFSPDILPLLSRTTTRSSAFLFLSSKFTSFARSLIPA